MKVELFKAVNAFMALFCAGTMYMNHVGVNVLSSEKAVSSVGSDMFEYQSTENEFSVHKNNKLVGKISTDKKLKFKQYVPKLRCNAAAIGVKVLAAGIGTAAAGGTFAAGAGAAGAGAVQTIVGGAGAVGAAIAPTLVPGAVALEATLAGAGEVAAIAAAEAATVGAGAALGTAAVVLGGALLFGGALA